MKCLPEIVRYGVCGGVTTLINLILFYILSELGIYYLLANAIAYYIAVIINFYLNLFLVFDKAEIHEGIAQKLWKFFTLRTVSLIVDSVLFFILISLFAVNKYVGRVCLSIAIIVLNFVWSKKNIFV